MLINPVSIANRIRTILHSWILARLLLNGVIFLYWKVQSYVVLYFISISYYFNLLHRNNFFDNYRKNRPLKVHNLKIVYRHISSCYGNLSSWLNYCDVVKFVHWPKVYSFRSKSNMATDVALVNEGWKHMDWYDRNYSWCSTHNRCIYIWSTKYFKEEFKDSKNMETTLRYINYLHDILLYCILCVWSLRKIFISLPNVLNLQKVWPLLNNNPNPDPNISEYIAWRP